MKRVVLLVLGTVYSLASFANDVSLQSFSMDLTDKETLQRGARMYMNYCSGCHSLKYMRYNRMAKDLGLIKFDGALDVPLLQNNLIFTEAKPYDPIAISLPEEDARQWFGKVPPDLSLKARERGSAWIYTYLKSFYVDKSRPFGANNALYPDVAMPDVLAPLRGVIAGKKLNNGQILLQPIHNGTMTYREFDQSLQDLVTFLTYVANPNQATGYKIGYFVLPLLIVFFFILRQLKKLYWKSLSFPSKPPLE